jgi:L-ascorbate metabolism protein UlaG (beta-lactamase superfamily)
MMSLVAAVTITWFGQAFFQLAASEGTVVIDPFDNTFFDYPIPKELNADVLLVTHEHNDHNNVGIVGGKPLVVRSEKGGGEFVRITKSQVDPAPGSIKVVGTAAYHDEQNGRQRGRNTIYSFELDGIRFCHVGDLGHLLSKEQAASIGAVDVLFVPVGGFFTLEVGKVRQLIDQLKPRVVVPMHYNTKRTPKLPIAPVDEFLSQNKDLPLKKLGASEFSLVEDELPKTTEIWVLSPP